MSTFDAQRFAGLLGNAREAVVIIDGTGTILCASQSSGTVLGIEPAEGIGRNILDFCAPSDISVASEILATAFELRHESIELFARHPSGVNIPVEVLPHNLLDTEGVIVLTIRNISERRSLDLAARQTENRFRLIANNAPIAMFHIGPDGNCLFMNRQWETMTDQTPDDALGLGWLTPILPHSRRQIYDFSHNTSSSETFEAMIQTPSGEQRTVTARWTPLISDTGEALGWVGTAEDITARKALEHRLAYQASHDLLTGLPNRSALLDALLLTLDSSNGDRSVAVYFIDLDNFKLVNDTLGHDAGDRLLIEVAHRLRLALRPFDAFGRLGGDEFMVVAAGVTTESEALALGNRINEALATPFLIGAGEPYHCRASVGVALAEPTSTVTSLISDADAAMYRAKEQGRDRVELFDTQLRSRAEGRLRIESTLRLALQQNELQLSYQPIFGALSREIRGVEALVRWSHPVRGLIGPGEFIQIAEQAGLITSIGSWVLSRACNDLHDFKDINLNLNMSGRQLADKAFVSQVALVLEDTDFEPSRLTFEITETALMTDVDNAVSQLKSLHSLGVSIAVDDFGTGYSSLSYLSRFPLSALKIDGSFIKGIGSSRRVGAPRPNNLVRSDVHGGGDLQIVTAAVQLAHALGLEAVGEGVETESQLSKLVELGCDMAQGSFLGEPVSIVALSRSPLISK